MSTNDFNNGKLPFCNAFAHSLEWLYDEDYFLDEKGEYDSIKSYYYMQDVFPLYDLMTILADIIFLAFGEYRETNIKNYISHLEEGSSMRGNPFFKYEGNYISICGVNTYTTQVILWASYLYCNFRAEIDNNKKNAQEAKATLYKLFRQNSCLPEEKLKNNFLMKQFNRTMLILLDNIKTEEDNHQKNKNTNLKNNTEENNETTNKPTNDEDTMSDEKKLQIDERIIFVSTALGVPWNSDMTNQTQLAKIIERFSGDDYKSIRSRIVAINKEIKEENRSPGEGLSQGTKEAVNNVIGWLQKATKGDTNTPAIESLINEIKDVFLNSLE